MLFGSLLYNVFSAGVIKVDQYLCITDPLIIYMSQKQFMYGMES